MSDWENRLIGCFASVFPGLTSEEIRTSSAESDGIWDSLSTVTLVAVVQEEFNVAIDPEEVAQLDSFAAFRACVSRLIPAEELSRES